MYFAEPFPYRSLSKHMAQDISLYMHAWRPSKVMSEPLVSCIPLMSSAFPSSSKLTSLASSCRIPYCRHLSMATSKTDGFIWYVALCLFRQWVFIFAILSIDMKNKLLHNLNLKNPFLMETLLLWYFLIFSTYFLRIRYWDMCGVH